MFVEDFPAGSRSVSASGVSGSVIAGEISNSTISVGAVEKREAADENLPLSLGQAQELEDLIGEVAELARRANVHPPLTKAKATRRFENTFRAPPARLPRFLFEDALGYLEDKVDRVCLRGLKSNQKQYFVVRILKKIDVLLERIGWGADDVARILRRRYEAPEMELLSPANLVDFFRFLREKARAK